MGSPEVMADDERRTDRHDDTEDEATRDPGTDRTDELSPHDIPKDHPGRREAEELSGGEGGTTRGNR